MQRNVVLNNQKNQLGWDGLRCSINGKKSRNSLNIPYVTRPLLVNTRFKYKINRTYPLSCLGQTSPGFIVKKIFTLNKTNIATLIEGKMIRSKEFDMLDIIHTNDSHNSIYIRPMDATMQGIFRCNFSFQVYDEKFDLMSDVWHARLSSSSPSQRFNFLYLIIFINFVFIFNK